MAHLSLRLFGAFECHLTGTIVQDFYSDKVRALLAYLVMEADLPHNRAVLAGTFWPELPEQKARQNLRLALFHLRKAIRDDSAETPFLLVTRGSVQFNRESAFECDVATFQSLIETAVSPHQSPENVDDNLLRSWETAVSLYRGHFLAQFFLDDCNAFEEWARQKRERLRRQVLTLVSLLVTQYRTRGEYQTAVQYAQRWLEIEPWQEEAHRELMHLYVSLGNHDAALAQYQRCEDILADELGIEPAKATQTLYKDIQQAQQAPLNNLPSQLTPFIGRAAELSAIHQHLANPNCQLLTLVGPGGIGKTRLAIEAAGQSHTFLHGVCFVSLVEVTTADLLPVTIVQALGLSFSGGTSPKDQLLDFLHAKHMLLVLDNFEHLLAEVGLVRAILEVGPQIKILVTSQERLNLVGETVWQVTGLEFAALKTVDEAERYTAVQLFVTSAKRVQPDFELKASDLPHLVQILHAVQGMPLAIELAAAWVHMLSIAEIAAEIAQSLDLLASNLRDIPERHRSIQAVFEHAWRRLPAADQAIFTALSIFRGDFTRQAARQVTNASIHTLAGLVNKSLLVSHPNSGRYILQPMLRQFVIDLLQQNQNEETAVRSRHSIYYCAVLKNLATDLIGTHQQSALTAIEADIENIRAAWQWAVTQGDFPSIAESLASLFHFYDTRSWFLEGEKVFRTAAAQLSMVGSLDKEQAVTIARLQARQGWLAFHLGQHPKSIQLLQKSLSQLQEQGATTETIFNLNYLGAIMRHLGEYEPANHYLSEALTLAQAATDDYQASISLNILGQVASLQGDYAAANQYCQEALHLKQAIGDRWGMTYALTYLGRIALAQGDPVEANQLFQKSKVISQELGDQRGMAFALQNLGDTARVRGQLETAVQLYRQGLAIFNKIGNAAGANNCQVRLDEIAAVLLQDSE